MDSYTAFVASHVDRHEGTGDARQTVEHASHHARLGAQLERITAALRRELARVGRLLGAVAARFGMPVQPDWAQLFLLTALLAAVTVSMACPPAIIVMGPLVAIASVVVLARAIASCRRRAHRQREEADTDLHRVARFAFAALRQALEPHEDRNADARKPFHVSAAARPLVQGCLAPLERAWQIIEPLTFSQPPFEVLLGHRQPTRKECTPAVRRRLLPEIHAALEAAAALLSAAPGASPPEGPALARPSPATARLDLQGAVATASAVAMWVQVMPAAVWPQSAFARLGPSGALDHVGDFDRMLGSAITAEPDDILAGLFGSVVSALRAEMALCEEEMAKLNLPMRRQAPQPTTTSG
ncbi:hypothetical protein [Cupriavidus sp. AU9028]|uniref:hypothetical protein n=1 Tax=Cupriavidus sp. AU9028 TaxID=2871157 RepID=UPI001C93CF67|nr:hypothetical protein [Cupriavidus sp. AU9028]MBY4895640.1 hypothetical protein [Cupriavidus sp. AU9028]